MKTIQKAQKKKRSLKRIAIVTVCLTASIVGLAVIFTSLYNHVQKVQREKNAVKTILGVTDGHHFAKTNAFDPWWISTSLEKNIETMNMLERRGSSMQALIRKYEDVSPATKAIAERFREFVIGVWVNGSPSMLRPKGTPTNENHTNFIVICFRSKKDAERVGIMVPVWQTSLGFITLPTIQIPEPLLANVLYHELGHAKKHNKVDGLPADIDGSTPYITEEVEMHELGGSILNAASSGKYHALLDQIARRFSSAKTFKGAMAMITRKDCLVLDDMFGCTETDFPSNVLITQAIMEIGFRYCNARSLDMPEKVKVYRWFEQHIFTPEMRR